MIPCQPVGAREVMSLTPVLGSTYSTLARNAMHCATDRGRIAAQCQGARSRYYLSAASKDIKIPLVAGPHDRIYQVRVCVAVQSRPLPGTTWPLDVTITTADRVGGGHSSTTPEVRIEVPSAAVDEGYTGRLLAPMTPIDAVNTRGSVLHPIWSGWITHVCDAALTQERLLTVTLTWDGGVPATGAVTWFWGLTVIALEDQELTGTTPADGAGIALPAWGTYPGPGAYSLEPGQPVTQEHVRGLVGVGHYLCAYQGRGQVGIIYGQTDAGVPYGRGTNPAAWTDVGDLLLRQRKHVTGLTISVLTNSHVGGKVRVTADGPVNVEIATAAGENSAVGTLNLARGDLTSTLLIEVRPDGGGTYHDLLSISIVDRDLTLAEVQALA